MLNDPFSMVVGIVAVLALVSVSRSWFSSCARNAPDELAALRTELIALRDRIDALERRDS